MQIQGGEKDGSVREPRVRKHAREGVQFCVFHEIIGRMPILLTVLIEFSFGFIFK